MRRFSPIGWQRWYQNICSYTVTLMTNIRSRTRLRIAAAVVAAVAVFAGPRLSGASAWASGTHSGQLYVVRPGDTLWSIVAARDPGRDPRPVVQEIAARLHGAVIYPGEQIRIPG